MVIEIRKAVPDDADQIFSLVQDFATSFHPSRRPFDHSFQRFLGDESALLMVAESQGDVIGYCLSFDHYAFYADVRL